MGVINDLKSLESESLARGIPIIGCEKAEWLLSKIEELRPEYVLELVIWRQPPSQTPLPVLPPYQIPHTDST